MKYVLLKIYFEQTNCP